MASPIYLDTHVAAWLYTGRPELIPDAARHRMAAGSLPISPMVRLELQLLHEIGRVSEPPGGVFQALASEIGLRVCDLPFDQVVVRALEQTWTRDPFDRVIAAQASLRESTLVAKDAEIRAPCPQAIWD